MAQTHKLILYTPHEKQLQLHQCKTRFAIGKFGRQSGKSTCAINELVKQAWIRPGTKYWFISPTFPQARVMYRRLVGMLWSCRDVMIKKNQTELRIKLVNNSEIRFVSGLVMDDLRGETLNGAVIDEVREQHPSLWPLVIRPMLATTKGWCWFISTPNGFDHFYDMAQAAAANADWTLFTAPSTANPLFTQAEADAAMGSMSEPQYAQEILAEFRSLLAGKVYFAFSDANKTDQCPFATGKYSPYHPVILGPDFNVNPMSWSMSQHVYEKWWYFDEVRLTDSNTIEAAKELRDKLIIMKENGWRAPDPCILICGDASGKARSTKSNESDYDILKGTLKEAGLSYRDITPEANPSIKDRVNAMNAQLKNAKGEANMFCHPTGAKWLIHDFERVLWKNGSDFTLDAGKEKMLTHMSDGAGYPVAELTPVKSVRTVGKTKIIARHL